MDKLTAKLAYILLAVAALTPALYAEETQNLVRPPDFRATVDTNKDVYFDRDVLTLTVSLLNNAATPVLIVRDAPPAPSPQPNDANAVFEGFIDNEDVDVIVRPEPPVVIGYVRIRLLGPSPTIDTSKQLLAPAVFRLPLFGSLIIYPHSTRIISTANILISYPQPVDPNRVEPPLDQPFYGAEIETIPAVGKYLCLKPGYYLVDCYINKIAGAPIVQAQKIIQVRPHRIAPTDKLLMDNSTVLRKLDNRTAEMQHVDKQTNTVTNNNNFLLKTILQNQTNSTIAPKP